MLCLYGWGSPQGLLHGDHWAPGMIKLRSASRESLKRCRSGLPGRCLDQESGDQLPCQFRRVVCSGPGQVQPQFVSRCRKIVADKSGRHRAPKWGMGRFEDVALRSAPLLYRAIAGPDEIANVEVGC